MEKHVLNVINSGLFTTRAVPIQTLLLQARLIDDASSAASNLTPLIIVMNSLQCTRTCNHYHDVILAGYCSLLPNIAVLCSLMHGLKT